MGLFPEELQLRRGEKLTRKNQAAGGKAICPLCKLKVEAETNKLGVKEVQEHLRREHSSPSDPIPSAAPGRRQPSDRIRSVVRGGLPGQGKKR